jgi:hypothetical protein
MIRFSWFKKIWKRWFRARIVPNGIKIAFRAIRYNWRRKVQKTTKTLKLFNTTMLHANSSSSFISVIDEEDELHVLNRNVCSIPRVTLGASGNWGNNVLKTSIEFIAVYERCNEERFNKLPCLL